jgi:hypothetical protein
MNLWTEQRLLESPSDISRVKRVHPHAGWTGYEGVFVTVSDAVRSMCLKVLNPISGRQMKPESELGPATSMSSILVVLKCLNQEECKSVKKP